MRVLLTGITGVLGEPLAARLARDPEIEEVVGVSRGPLPRSLAADGDRDRKVNHLACDFRDPRVGKALGGVDVLIHAAFQPYGRDTEALRRVNVDGSNRLHRAAGEAGVRHVVFVSSAAAYGSHVDNALPLPEDARLRPNPESFYSVHKAEVEWALDRLAEEDEAMAILRVRPTILLGPRADRGAEAIRRYFHRIVPRFRSDDWYWQFLHTDDAAEAIARAVVAGETGALNLAAPDWLTHDELAEITGGRIVNLPDWSVWALPLLQRLGISPVGRDRAVLSRHPIVLATDRLRARLMLEPRSSAETLRDFLRTRGT